MKNTEDQNLLKQALNEALSKTVKLLQTKAKVEGDSVIQSDNQPLQQFLPVLEAAFIHGLKIKYYEKQKNQNDLPKPQFWNLICKLSHKNTIDQIRKLNYVKTNVGRCRAWLRLALNELALSSYLAALLQSSEYAELLLHYYDSHALFQDNEQRDIFLSYLQGTENLTFELVYNSAILDSWTKTPLELSGIIHSSTAKKQFISSLNAIDHLSVFNQSMKHARSFDSLSTFSNKDENVSDVLKETFHSSYESSSYQLSPSSSEPTSNPAIQVEEVDGVVETKGHLTNQPDKAENLNVAAAVLFERHLNPKRRSKRKHEDGRLTPQSRCSSSLSINSYKLDKSFEEADSPVINRSRASSAGSQKDSSVTNAASDLSQLHMLASEDGEITSNVPEDGEITSNVHSSLPNAASRSEETPDTTLFAELGKQLSDTDSDVHTNESTANRPNKLKLDETNSDFVLKVGNNVSPTERNNVDELPEVVLQENTLSETSSSHEDFDDIYAEDYLRSRTGTDVLSKADNSTLLSSMLSESPGYGNSLLCGLGWSSEVDGEFKTSRSVIQTQPTFNDSYHSDCSDETELVIREGILQKKSFGIWRDRWFVLTTSTLVFCKDQTRKEELGVIHLVNIETIDDNDVEKKRIMSLKMLNGDDHQVGATNSKTLAGWAEDLRRSMKNVKENFINLNAIETTYVMLNANEDDGEIESSWY